MSKFNKTSTRPAGGTSPVFTEAAPTGKTFEGAPGYARDAKSELFLLAVSNMVGEQTFYEQADARDSRYQKLVRQVAVADPEWTAGFLAWLRGDANMRSAALVGAAEFVRGRLAAGGEQQLPRRDHTTEGTDSLSYSTASNRRVIASVLQRADEPGELLAYWTSRHGRAIPKPVKRGIAAAVGRLYTEYTLLKYDTATRGFRFADVIELVHPAPVTPRQGELFRYALARRHNRPDVPDPEALPMVAFNRTLRALAATNPERHLLDQEALRRAGMTWEDALSLAGSTVDKAKLWEALIPSMGYMALLRNLRNFDQAGVSDQVAEQVAARLADPDQVAKSRQFPFRFYAAYNAVGSLRWGHALEKALAASLANVPALPGRTLVLVDQSPSMFPGYYSAAQQVMRDISNADVAKMFGSALALRAANATLVGYGHTNYRVPFGPGEAVLRVMGKFRQEYGTDAYGAARDHFDRHDRIVVVTDGENNGSLRSWKHARVPGTVPIYTWNIAGYRLSQDPGGRNRHTFGGLTDQAFRMIPLLEAGKSQTWPWVSAN
ncbi:TROVE domain-containing protein [Phytohabitans kaempferiae]|uniref:TROVE domain-containing protein n=1 Tax=Phytohabitans kaempferiae TaxID=1620943 RepID=A0ABV6MCR2_9ACTN